MTTPAGVVFRRGLAGRQPLDAMRVLREDAFEGEFEESLEDLINRMALLRG